MSDDNKTQALAEKDLGNQAYKKREFETALTHYSKAYELDDTNITFLTNKAGKYP
jgi:Flp pilus assembly protein TadD